MIYPISTLMNKDIPNKNVIINLWNSPDRLVDFIGGDHLCPHLTKKDSKCSKCGSTQTTIGHEKNPLDYYKHVDLLSNSFTKAENVYVITHRPYPEDYVLPVFGMALTNYKGFKYKRMYTIFDKVNPYSTAGKPNITYVIHYTNSPSDLWENPFIYMKSFDPLVFMDTYGTLLVNPNKKDFKYYQSDFTFFIPNKSILVLLENHRLRDSVNVLKV